MGTSLAAGVAAILDRDLRTLRRELEAYPDERQIWQAVPGLPNSAGTLALHLAGNLQHYIGARLGGAGYVRNRDAEFSRRDVPRAELLAEIERARTAIAAALPGVALRRWRGTIPRRSRMRTSAPTNTWSISAPTSPTISASSTVTGGSSPAIPPGSAPSGRSSWAAHVRWPDQQLVIGPLASSSKSLP
jgi:hypothetical protein